MASAPLIRIVARVSSLGFLSLALHCTLSVTVRFIFLKCVCKSGHSTTEKPSLTPIAYRIKYKFLTQTIQALHTMHCFSHIGFLVLHSPTRMLVPSPGMLTSLFLSEYWNPSIHSSSLMVIPSLQWRKCFSYCL